MSTSNGITEDEHGTLTWLTDHGDKVTVFRKDAPRSGKESWWWKVQAKGNNETVGGNESHPRRLAAKAAAIRHHPPTPQPPQPDVVVGPDAVIEQTSNPAEVGSCRYCGQQLVRTATDCWHPRATTTTACPPEDLVRGVPTPRWGNFGRPGREAFVTAEDEAHVRQHTEERGLIYAGGDPLANHVWSGPAEQLAARFHETYERLAPEHGYETRDASAKPWPQVPENNRGLMTAVLAELTEGPNAPLVRRPPVPSDQIEAAVAAMRRTREFAAGTGFGVPADAMEAFATALATAALTAAAVTPEPTWEDERAELVRLSRRHELDNHHNAALCPYCSPRSDAIDVVHLARQAAWSERTFGPGTREKGVIQHIRTELIEIEDATTPERKQKEWIDVAILGLDGAWRAGLTPQQIVAAVQAKQTLNEGRVWPDWRTMSEDIAIEHDRTAGGDDA